MTEQKKAPEIKTVAIRVMRDFWRTEDDRVRAGTVLEVSPMEAIEGIESGAFERVK